MQSKRRAAVLSTLLLSSVMAFAQQAAPTAPSSAKESRERIPVTTASEDETIVLTPFEVSANKDTGYQATETLAGTRIRTELKDVGAAISVITKDLMNDIGATDSATLLQYTTNAEVAGTRGTYAGLGNGAGVDESSNLRSPAGAQRVRGLAAADNTRDYFVTDIPWDSYNVDRIDILRGPNSILFGLGSPSGIVNASIRNPEFRNFGNVELRTGSYGTVRGSIDLNQSLIKNVLALRVDGLRSLEKYQQKPAFQNDKRVTVGVRFDPQFFRDRSFHTTIKVKFEAGDINANRPRIVPPTDAISPWFRSVLPTADNPYGGLGMTLINNPYDPYRTDGVTAANQRGTLNSSTINYLPWVSDPPNQQQPFYTIDGTTNQLYGVNGGYINNGARNSAGAFTGVSSGMVNKRQNGMFYIVGNLPGVATAAGRSLPNSQYGVYKNMSLLDPTIFDFYNTLIDGPTKMEFQKWTAMNIDFSQTGWNDRVGLQVTLDHQKNKQGGQALLGGGPTLSMDILKNFPDYYLNPGSGGVNNPNVGRPIVTGAGGNGGNQSFSDRKYLRASLFAELRTSDLTKNDFLVKLFGKHRFNGVFSDERYFNENRSWQMYANSQEWAGYWNGNTGNTSGIGDRTPLAFIYLGSSIAGRTAAAGANIPGIKANVTLPDHGVYVFDTTWKNPTGVNYADVWNVPSSMYSVYNGLPNTESTTQLTQASNPANYVGWNSNFQNQLLRYNMGQDESLLTLAQKSLKQTLSYAGSYQGFLWKDALVATLGWRYDEVKTKDVNAKNQPSNRNMLNLQPDVYSLPTDFPLNQIVKGHSTSGGAVLHLNKILDRDILPINISLSYNESSNFQVTSVRRDLYGNPLGNPTGKTYEKGILLSTKDNKFSFRMVNYTTRVKNGAAGLNNQGGLGGVIQQGLKWRNVFLYQLGGYDWASRNQPSYRNTWTNGYPTMTDAAALAMEDQAITGWNNIQNYLDAKGFFKAWNFTPTTASALTTRSNFIANPAQYTPDPATVYGYVALPNGPQGFTVTADTQSTGYEYELTANPTPNWRVSVNASQTVAIRQNVGGQTMTDFVNYINSQFYDASGNITPTGALFQFGGAASSIAASNWGPWRGNYLAMKLQENAAAPEIRKWRYNVVTNYSFRNGLLKGIGVGAAYRWQDKVIIGYPVSTAGLPDLQTPYYGPEEKGVDLWVSYERKLTSKINYKLQMNIRNAFARDGLIPISIEPDGKTWASVRVKPTQEWFLTNTFSF